MNTARPMQEAVSGPGSFRGALMILVQSLVIAILGTGTVLAQQASNSLTDIEVRALPGNKVELRLVMSEPAPAPLTFTIDQPARIAVDLPDTGLALGSRRKDINIGSLDTVLVAEANGRTRVVLNLDNMVPYDTRVDGNVVVVTLSPGGGPPVTQFAATESSAGETAASAATRSTSSNVRSVQNIDFRRSDAGGGRVIIQMSDAGTPVDVRQEGGSIVVNFVGTELPQDLMKRLDVIDFGTPVRTIDALRVGEDARLVIAAQGPFEELAYQSDNVFSVEIYPLVEEETEVPTTLYSQKREYTGERLTLNFQDIDSRAVLQLLADISGRNIVVSDTVQGNVTLRLQNVPWDQALDIVLATKGLDMRENGNVIIVAPSNEIASREKADLEARKEIKQLEPLISEYMQVNYAKAGDLADLIMGGGENSLLSERGTVGIDERTNTLLLQDTSDNISDIRRLVTTLDIPVKQVLIESRIVIVSDDYSRDLGIRWGATVVSDRSDGLIAVSGNAQGTDDIVNSALDNQLITGSLFPVDIPDLEDRFQVNLPTSSAAGTLGVAVLGDDYLVDLELSAVQAEGRGEVISSPRVITANQKEASIEQGVEIPYQESSSSGATTTQFKDALLSLTVTPQITPDDRIIMDLHVTKDSVGEQVTTERGGSVPSIDTRSVTTQVLVNNGQTVVLGGIYETEYGEFVTKVPVLGDIPYLGYLFRRTQKVSNKAELLIFVTPKILKDGATIY